MIMDMWIFCLLHLIPPEIKYNYHATLCIAVDLIPLLIRIMSL